MSGKLHQGDKTITVSNISFICVPLQTADQIFPEDTMDRAVMVIGIVAFSCSVKNGCQTLPEIAVGIDPHGCHFSPFQDFFPTGIQKNKAPLHPRLFNESQDGIKGKGCSANPLGLGIRGEQECPARRGRIPLTEKAEQDHIRALDTGFVIFEGFLDIIFRGIQRIGFVAIIRQEDHMIKPPMFL